MEDQRAGPSAPPACMRRGKTSWAVRASNTRPLRREKPCPVWPPSVVVKAKMGQ